MGLGIGISLGSPAMYPTALVRAVLGCAVPAVKLELSRALRADSEEGPPSSILLQSGALPT